MNLNGRLSYTGNVHGSMGASLVADVEANPSGAPSQTLISIRVGDVIYSIPSGGGGGGTSDYNALNNKPKVNNITLSGDLTLADLGIQPAISFPGDGSKYLDGNGSFSTPAAGIVDYSTSEVNTGQKWIDGKDIYSITITDIADNSWYSISSLNIDSIVDTSFYFITTDQIYVGNINAGGGYIAYLQIGLDYNRIMYNISSWPVSQRVVTLYYTKQ